MWVSPIASCYIQVDTNFLLHYYTWLYDQLWGVPWSCPIFSVLVMTRENEKPEWQRNCSISERCFRVPLKAAVCSSSRNRFNRAGFCFLFFSCFGSWLNCVMLVTFSWILQAGMSVVVKHSFWSELCFMSKRPRSCGCVVLLSPRNVGVPLSHETHISDTVICWSV